MVGQKSTILCSLGALWKKSMQFADITRLEMTWLIFAIQV